MNLIINDIVKNHYNKKVCNYFKFIYFIQFSLPINYRNCWDRR